MLGWFDQSNIEYYGRLDRFMCAMIHASLACEKKPKIAKNYVLGCFIGFGSLAWSDIAYSHRYNRCVSTDSI